MQIINVSSSRAVQLNQNSILIDITSDPQMITAFMLLATLGTPIITILRKNSNL